MRTTLLLIVISHLITTNIYSQCHYVQATGSSNDTVVYTYSGGTFSSFGCAPIDPTYWLSGNGKYITATFVVPEDYPVFRVWGMNSDDSASVEVNGTPYSLNYNTGTYLPKVVCGLSPGPDGVAFNNNKFYGVNSPAAGNYSYSDIQLFATAVNSITVTGTSGAGWGFAGVLVNCPLISGIPVVENSNLILYPNPLSHSKLIQLNHPVSNASIVIYNITGKKIYSENHFFGDQINLTGSLVNSGVYYIIISEQNRILLSEKLMIVNDLN